MQEKHADSHPPEARGNLFITPHAHTSAPPAPAPHPPHPRIESASSWVLLSFVTNEPQWDLPNPGFYVSFFFFFFTLAFFGWHSRHTEVPRLGNQSLSHWPTPQTQQHQVRSVSATYTTVQGNARSFTH